MNETEENKSHNKNLDKQVSKENPASRVKAPKLSVKLEYSQDETK